VCMYQVAETALAATGYSGHDLTPSCLTVGRLGFVMIGFHNEVQLRSRSINSTPSRNRVKSLSHRAFVLTMVKSRWISYNQMQLAIACMSA
jgi:hypothetical protein